MKTPPQKRPRVHIYCQIIELLLKSERSCNMQINNIRNRQVNSLWFKIAAAHSLHKSLPNRHLLVLSHHWKHQNKVLTMETPQRRH